MFMKRLLEAALAAAMMVAAGVANADLLTIVPTLPLDQPGTSHSEAAGQASGTIYPWPGGPGGGAGIPSSASGWPVGPGFALEPGFTTGTSGFDTSYLQLNQQGWVTFQFMGGGNSTLQNSFWIDLNGAAAGGWTEMFQDSHGGPTNPCPVTPNGAQFPSCDLIAPGLPDGINLTYNQYTLFMDPANFTNGLIPFAFDLNGSSGNESGDPAAGPINSLGQAWGNTQYPGASGNPADNSDLPGFFLGVDPYLATGTFQLSGTAVYAGLADLPRPGDHDYQDMVVRISVPEPGSLALLGLALGGLALSRRRKGANA
jgi:hypothetical protein